MRYVPTNLTFIPGHFMLNVLIKIASVLHKLIELKEYQGKLILQSSIKHLWYFR